MVGISGRAAAAADEIAVLKGFFETLSSRLEGRGDACDFTFGNPHEMPLSGLVAALHAGAEPRSADWFAYKASEPEPTAAVATALSGELGMPFAREDVVLTRGAFGAIALAFQLVMDAGAEVVIPVPGWFLYAPMLRAADLVPVKAALEPERFDLDLAAIEAAITPRTRMVVVNSPHNPTGRIYGREALKALADLLEAASRRIGARIWLLSDEPYRRIRFDGNGFTSPAEVYPWTLIDYSYGKVLLAPGQRLGYLALVAAPAGARAVGVARGVLRGAGVAWLGVSRRDHAAWGGGAGDGEHRHGGAGRAARPDARGAGAVGLRHDPARGDVLSLGRGARRRFGAVCRSSGGAGRACDAGDAVRAAGRFSHLSDCQRRDGRAGVAGVPRRRALRGAVAARLRLP